MKVVTVGLLLLISAFGDIEAKKGSSKCPLSFQPPSQCVSLDDIKDYGITASSLESLYNRYVNLLTSADLTIDGDEAGVELFFGGELSPEIRKLKFHGNSIVTFLSIALHHSCRMYGTTGKELLYCLSKQNITADLFEICEQYENVNCADRATHYQPLDGVCTNFEFPYRGAVNTPYKRILPNAYDDAIHEVRSSAHNNDLPSARLISTGLRTLYVPPEIESPDHLQNDLILFYAGIVIMDMAKTLKAQTWDGNFGFECCDCDGKSPISQRFFNHHCMPIEIPDKDATFRGAKCMNFIRSMVTHDNCEFKEASIINAVTHFLDLDILYGDVIVSKAIKNGGKFSENEHDLHQTIILGDERSTAQPQFYALIMVWIKFHNRVFDEISTLHPELSNEVKFYETRRFVIAVYQNVLFTEVLPLLVSERSIAKYKLSSQKPCYKSSVDPSVTAEFTSSVARFFHNFLQNGYVVNFKNGTSAEILLRNSGDENLKFNEFTGVLTGLLDRTWNLKDISDEISNYFYSRHGPGLDLRAIDLQTERDFGIGTYCDALYYYNLTGGDCVKKFKDFEPFISDENIAFLKYAYEEPCDVDFGVGASMHSSRDGHLLSDIFDNIFAEQFKKVKCGDPFFYTNALTKDQIDIIDKISFQDVLCLTVPDLPPIQPDVFLTPGENNKKEACSIKLDLKDWKLSFDTNSPVPDIPKPSSRRSDNPSRSNRNRLVPRESLQSHEQNPYY